MNMELRILLLCIIFVLYNVYGVDSAVFTVKNNCKFTIWPATLAGKGPQLLTGFALAAGASRQLTVSPPWSGRVWSRTSCTNSGKITCLTGDCGSGQVECGGKGGAPPATLIEFTLGGANGQDFYDVSLVDGFNLPVSVKPSGAKCPTTACPADVNRSCPKELAISSGAAVVGCKSACAAFNKPQYCCTGGFNTPAKCPPTNYSQMFKKLCPQAYSYAYDDKSSTFTCPTGGNFLITFC